MSRHGMRSFSRRSRAEAIKIGLNPACAKANLRQLSRMKTVAIIGASSDRNKFGNKAVRAFREQGYQVYPVNPKESEIEGLQAYKNILEVPVRPEMISVYVPPPVLFKLLPDIADRKSVV